MNSSSSSGFDAEALSAATSSSGREARNLAEKHRRDKLNASIHELSTMVPHVAESSRRLDKTAVLRFAAHGLRLRYVFGKSSKKNAITAGTDSKSHLPLSDTLMQLLDSFFITLTCHGQIVLISPSVEHLLGHCQCDLYGQSLQHITHPEDHALLKQQLIPNNLETLFRLAHEDYLEHSMTSTLDDERSGDDCDEQKDLDDCLRSPSPHTLAHQTHIDERLREDRRCFTVRLARAGTRAESARSYEIVKIDGCFRRSDCTSSNGNYPIVSQLIRRARGQHLQHDAIAQAALHGISGNDIVFVAMGRIIRPPKVLENFPLTNKLEYKTRHLIDGRIIDCDQRIGLVAGYMKDEVTNLSPFSFMHQDDVRWVIVALRQMYDCNSDYGESCYRLLSRNGNFIYLQTKGYMEIDKNTNKVHSFVCINTLLDEKEGKRKVQEMKNKFSTIINVKIPSSSMVDVPASQNPQQLEKIVLCLIENLHKPDETDVNSSSASSFEQTRYTKTPPMALVPPERASVKHSITKSVNIVNVTAAKKLLVNQQSPRSVSLSPASSMDDDNNVEECISDASTSIQQERPSVLKLSGQNVTYFTQSSIIRCNSKESQTRLQDATISVPSNSCLSGSEPNSASQMLQQQISVLKRLHASSSATSTCPTQTNTDIRSPAKRSVGISQSNGVPSSKEIHNVLSTSLQKLDHRLHTADRDAITLCEQRKLLKPHAPHAINQKLGKINVEQQKEKEIIVNIRGNYGVRKMMPQPPTQQNVVSNLRVGRISRPTVTATNVSSASTVLKSNNYKLKLNTLTKRKPS